MNGEDARLNFINAPPRTLKSALAGALPPPASRVVGIAANEVKGFVGETLVAINIDRAQSLKAILQKHITEFDRNGHSSSSGGCKKVLARLSSLLADVNVPPPLPPMVFGKCHP